MVRTATLILGMLGLLWQTAACSADSGNDGPGAQPPAASPSFSPESGRAPSTPPAASASPATPVSPASPPDTPDPATPPTSTTPTSTTPASTTPAEEVPGALPWGARTLTGVVERSGGCTVLVARQRRWVLTGRAVATLVPGAKVTVRGNLTTRPDGCGEADGVQAVAVTRVNPI